MNIHNEISFETEICQHLAEHGWLYTERRCGGLRPGAGAVPGGCAGVDAGHAAGFGARGNPLWFGMIHLGPWQLQPLVLMFAVSGSLMISRTLHIPKP